MSPFHNTQIGLNKSGFGIHSVSICHQYHNNVKSLFLNNTSAVSGAHRSQDQFIKNLSICVHRPDLPSSHWPWIPLIKRCRMTCLRTGVLLHCKTTVLREDFPPVVRNMSWLLWLTQLIELMHLSR